MIKNYSLREKIPFLLSLFMFCSLSSAVYAQPANDNVADAMMVVVDGAPAVVAPFGASAEIGEEALVPPNNGCVPHSWCDTDGITQSTWYTFSVPASGAARVSLCGANFDAQLAAYTATDAADFSTYTMLDASDDVPVGGGPNGENCGPGALDAVPQNLAGWFDLGCLPAGETVYVLVDIFSSDEGVTVFAETDTVVLDITSIDAPAAIVIDSFNVVEPACTGLPGTATVNFTGQFPFDIAWSTGDTTETISATTGSYTVTVTDFCGTSADMTIEIPDGPPPVAIELADDVTFPPLCDNTGGQIMVMPITGIAPFTYTWSNGGSTATIGGLSAGDYSVTIADACGGDPAIQTVTLEENPGENVGAGEDAELCGSSVTIGPEDPETSSSTMIGYNIGDEPEGGIACRGGGAIAQNSFFRPIELSSFGYEEGAFVPVTGVEFFYASTPAAGFNNFIPGVEVALHSATSADLSIATFTELERVFLNLEGTDDETISFRVPFTNSFISTSEVLVVELTINAASTDGHRLDFRTTSILPVGATLTYITSSDCGIGTPTSFPSIGFPDANLLVNAFIADESDFTYQWDNAANLDDATAQNPVASAIGTYNVTITDNACGTTIEDSMEVLECDPNSVLDPADYSFLINPNPSAGNFVIRNEGNGKDIQLVVHDLQGRLINNTFMTFGSGEAKDFDLSEMAKGIYFLQMTYDNQTEVHRLIIQ